MVGQISVEWTGTSGGTGYTVLNFDNVSTVTHAGLVSNAVRTFFDSIKGLVPNEVTFNVTPECRIIDPSTGVLVDAFPVSWSSPIVATNTNGYNRAGGARVDWATGAIVAGRRLRGRTYLVPLGSSVYTATGDIASGSATTIQTAASTLITTASVAGCPLVVWSRTAGQARVVTSASVPILGAILRSRRD